MDETKIIAAILTAGQISGSNAGPEGAVQAYQQTLVELRKLDPDVIVEAMVTSGA